VHSFDDFLQWYKSFSSFFPIIIIIQQQQQQQQRWQWRG